MEKINIKSKKKNELIEITSELKTFIESKNIKEGICVIFCPHTTAGITINEAFDPSVKTDIIYSMNKISPDYPEFRHAEGNSDAHVKSSLFGPSLTLIISEGKLALGTWQGIYFTEFDGPRSREVWIKIIAG
ncbi:MAG: secondary thiamine-phosphate synthase enzyme YjbQ [bacterium]